MGNGYYILAALSSRSTGSTATASELAIPKKWNHILALENPILQDLIHDCTHIICFYELKYVQYEAGPGTGLGGPSRNTRQEMDTWLDAIKWRVGPRPCGSCRYPGTSLMPEIWWQLILSNLHSQSTTTAPNHPFYSYHTWHKAPVHIYHSSTFTQSTTTQAILSHALHIPQCGICYGQQTCRDSCG